ncbi:MAG TPA: hypothetical protein VFJ87_03345 [Rhodanobacteraceae bacterium]|jgi:hypothetical protein|nr:hypothetical protein [Rhodanobacteraceae bacterium]
MDMNPRTLLIFAAIFVLVVAGFGYLLATLPSSSDWGVHCTRSGSEASCEVSQTRFLGVFGNSSFTIPETAINGAKTSCSGTGRRSHSCTVDLLLSSGRYRDYPVLSYPLRGAADASTQKLNAYFADRSMPEIRIMDDISRTMWIVVLPMLLVILLGVPLAWLRARRRTVRPTGV